MAYFRCPSCKKITNQQKFNQQVRVKKLSISPIQEIFPGGTKFFCHNCAQEIPFHLWTNLVPKYIEAQKKFIVCTNSKCRGIMDKKSFIKEVRMKKWALTQLHINQLTPPYNLTCRKCKEEVPYEKWKTFINDYLHYKNRCSRCKKAFNFNHFLKVIESDNLSITALQKISTLACVTVRCKSCSTVIPYDIWNIFIDDYVKYKKQQQSSYTHP
ncbi:hypothetical protein [Priestia megaterium]|uniref:hypothetical protein n=1 Tax=Priestia megaterium TaxID=1404 RepID=UPI0030009CC6